MGSFQIVKGDISMAKNKTLLNTLTNDNMNRTNEEDEKMSTAEIKDWKSKIRKIKRKDGNKWFWNPVSENNFDTKDMWENYLEKIQQPMNLNEIESKINKGKYTKASQIQDDIRLIFTNAMSFNEVNTDGIYEKAQELLMDAENMFCTLEPSQICTLDTQKSQKDPSESNRTLNTQQNLVYPSTTQTDPLPTSNSNIVLEAYEHVAHWRKNLFSLPSGKTGNLYIQELTQNINNWCADIDRKNSIYKIMIMPSLLLQKTEKIQHVAR